MRLRIDPSSDAVVAVGALGDSSSGSPRRLASRAFSNRTCDVAAHKLGPDFQIGLEYRRADMLSASLITFVVLHDLDFCMSRRSNGSDRRSPAYSLRRDLMGEWCWPKGKHE